MRFLKRYRFLLLIGIVSFLISFSIKTYAKDSQSEPKTILVGVGDAMLTYAAYVFELPPDWTHVVNEETIQLTHQRGFWMGRRTDKDIAITIVPVKKESDQGLADIIKAVIQQNADDYGCPSNSMRESFNFKPLVNYPYKVYTWNCPKNTCGLSVFVELPEHVVFFNLSGQGEDEKYIVPYFNDFDKILTSFKWTLEPSKEVSLSTDIVKKKGALVFVGDAALTYASYFFELPTNWIPLMDNMEATHQTGYWHGKQKDSQTLMEIFPYYKKQGKNLPDFVNFTKKYYEEKGLPSGSLQKYPLFKPSINDFYEVYSLVDSQRGTYDLFVFIDLPEYVINFILTGEGKDEKCITPHLEDFNKVITSFRWTLGLSDEEIGRMLKE